MAYSPWAIPGESRIPDRDAGVEIAVVKVLNYANDRKVIKSLDEISVKAEWRPKSRA